MEVRLWMAVAAAAVAGTLRASGKVPAGRQRGALAGLIDDFVEVQLPAMQYAMQSSRQQQVRSIRS